jgi:flagellar hook-associated protein 1 FlgK
MSTFSGIEMGKRSLFAHNQAIQTAGHNLSNSSTEGYSRQRVELKATDPLYRPDLSLPDRSGRECPSSPYGACVTSCSTSA